MKANYLILTISLALLLPSISSLHHRLKHPNNQHSLSSLPEQSSHHETDNLNLLELTAEDTSVSEHTESTMQPELTDPTTAETILADLTTETADNTQLTNEITQAQVNSFESDIISDALAFEEPLKEKANNQVLAEVGNTEGPVEADNRSLITKVVDYVKEKVSGAQADLPPASTTLNEQAQIPQPVELGTGITSGDFALIAETIASEGTGTKAYLESAVEEKAEKGETVEETKGNSEGMELKMPFSPNGRDIGKYEENETKELQRALPAGPFTQEYFSNEEVQERIENEKGLNKLLEAAKERQKMEEPGLGEAF